MRAAGKRDDLGLGAGGVGPSVRGVGGRLARPRGRGAVPHALGLWSLQNDGLGVRVRGRAHVRQGRLETPRAVPSGGRCHRPMPSPDATARCHRPMPSSPPGTPRDTRPLSHLPSLRARGSCKQGFVGAGAGEHQTAPPSAHSHELQPTEPSLSGQAGSRGSPPRMALHFRAISHPWPFKHTKLTELGVALRLRGLWVVRQVGEGLAVPFHRPAPCTARRRGVGARSAALPLPQQNPSSNVYILGQTRQNKTCRLAPWV